jgi:hypothetical protein
MKGISNLQFSLGPQGRSTAISKELSNESPKCNSNTFNLNILNLNCDCVTICVYQYTSKKQLNNNLIFLKYQFDIRKITNIRFGLGQQGRSNTFNLKSFNLKCDCVYQLTSKTELNLNLIFLKYQIDIPQFDICFAI